jgi:hypothetical protein
MSVLITCARPIRKYAMTSRACNINFVGRRAKLLESVIATAWMAKRDIDLYVMGLAWSSLTLEYPDGQYVQEMVTRGRNTWGICKRLLSVATIHGICSHTIYNCV